MTGTAFYPLGDQISFCDQQELIDKILRIDFNQGSEKKTTYFRERYTLAQYLLTLASQSLLIYPAIIVKNETPDFIWYRGDLEFGVEVTEGTTQKYRRGIAHHSRTRPGQFIINSDFSSTRSPRGGWAGRDGEREWVDIAVCSMLKKTDIYARREKPFEHMELLINMFTPVGGFETEEFSELRQDLLCALERWDNDNKISKIFDAVHLISGSNIVIYADELPKLVVAPCETQWSLRRRDELKQQLKKTGLL